MIIEGYNILLLYEPGSGGEDYDVFDPRQDLFPACRAAANIPVAIFSFLTYLGAGPG